MCKEETLCEAGPKFLDDGGGGGLRIFLMGGQASMGGPHIG